MVCAFMILLCPVLSVAADLESAKRAYADKDYAKALKEATPLAEQGNAEAQFLLGKMYWIGEGVLKDPERAIKLFKASGLQGNADAQFYVGSYYLLPLRDVLEGAKWLRVSAEQGSKDAQWL
ncbi:MAG: sel1 repeat family protein, partial [Acidobacteria bacterium]